MKPSGSDDWAKEHGLTISRGLWCPLKLVGIKHCDNHLTYWNFSGKHFKRSGESCAHGHVDHQSLWLKAGRPKVYVYQPYKSNFLREDLRALERMCERYDLWFTIGDQGWHNPGHVHFIEVMRQGETLEWDGWDDPLRLHNGPQKTFT